jgi:hypothetical protein
MEPTIVEVFAMAATLTGALGGSVGFVVWLRTRNSSQISEEVTLWTAASFPAAVLVAVVVAVHDPPDPNSTRVATLGIESQ